MGNTFAPGRRVLGVLFATVVFSTVATSVALGLATPAAAQVTVDAGGAAQGDAAKLVFHITNDGPTPITKVEIQLPPEAPIAEVYPMSAANWAPTTTSLTLPTPLPGIHGPNVSETVSAVTYTAMPGQELPPGGNVDLEVTAGPMPALGRIVFTVVETHADGSTRNTNPVATLADPAANPAASVPTAGGAGEGQPAAAPTSGRSTGGSDSAWWVFAAFVLIGGVTVFGVLRQRRPRPAAATADVVESADDSTKDNSEAVPAGH
jgi:hypothetical protein